LCCCGFTATCRGGSAETGDWTDDDLLDILLFCTLGGDTSTLLLSSLFYPKLMDYRLPPTAGQKNANSSAGQTEEEPCLTPEQRRLRAALAAAQAKYTYSNVARYFKEKKMQKLDGTSSVLEYKEVYIPLWPNGNHWALAKISSSSSSSVSEEEGGGNFSRFSSSRGVLEGRGCGESGGGGSSSSINPSRRVPVLGNSVEIRGYDSYLKSAGDRRALKGCLENLARWYADEWDAAVSGKDQAALRLGTSRPRCTAVIGTSTTQDDLKSCGIWMIENAWAVASGCEPSGGVPLEQAQARALLLVKGLVKWGLLKAQSETITLP
jgi:hypothetical protein